MVIVAAFYFAVGVWDCKTIRAGKAEATLIRFSFPVAAPRRRSDPGYGLNVRNPIDNAGRIASVIGIERGSERSGLEAIPKQQKGKDHAMETRAAKDKDKIAKQKAAKGPEPAKKK